MCRRACRSPVGQPGVHRVSAPGVLPSGASLSRWARDRKHRWMGGFRTGPRKAGHVLPFGPAVPPRCVPVRKECPCPPEDGHRMFQAARLTTPSKGKQSECPPAVGWMRRSCGVRVTDPVRVNRRPPRAGPGQIPFVAQPKKPGAPRPGVGGTQQATFT